MQKRGLILLAAATVALVVLAIVAIATGDRGVSRAAPGERAFPALAAKLGDVGSVGIKRNALSLTFVRDGDNWLVAEKGNYPAAAGKVRQIVLAIGRCGARRTKDTKGGVLSAARCRGPGQRQIDPRDIERQVRRDARRNDHRQAALTIGSAPAPTASMSASSATPRHGSPAARSNSPISSPAGSTGASSIFPRSGSPRRP